MHQKLIQKIQKKDVELDPQFPFNVASLTFTRIKLKQKNRNNFRILDTSII